jgi:hypothetical protein
VRQLIRAGRHEPKIETQEADLYMNPRRVRQGAIAGVLDRQRQHGGRTRLLALFSCLQPKVSGFLDQESLQGGHF